MNEKLKVNLRAWLLGKHFFDAARALELCIVYHPELRKDGVTPYYLHPMFVAQYLRTVGGDDAYERDLEEVLIVALLHDVLEDGDFGGVVENFGNIDRGIHHRLHTFLLVREKTFEILRLLNKHCFATKDDWYKAIATNPIAAIVKGADRFSNLDTMEGVFTRERQEKYVHETENLVLPCLKTARRNFPEYDNAFENVRLVLKLQTGLLKRTFL